MCSQWDLDSETKVLLHLLGFQRYKGEFVVPVDITQRGISEAIGVKLTHVSRLTKSLVSEGFIEERKAHVTGIRRRVKVYFLTESGKKRAEKVMERLMKTKFPAIMDGEEVELTYEDIRGRTSSGILEIAEMLKKDGIVDVRALEPPPVGTFLVFHPPEISDFIGRESEMDELEELLQDDSVKVLMIYGNPGYGKSALLFIVLKRFSRRANVLWFPLNGKTKLPEILNGISSFLSSLGKSGLEPLMFEQRPMDEIARAIGSRLSGTGSMMVFDGYEEMRDEVVEFFIQLFNEIKGIEGVKMVFTAREDTPYYSRFYGPSDVKKGTVKEYHVSGLSKEETGEFLGIRDENALQKIHLLTKGNPALLKMLRERDSEALKATGRFSIEEIKMLLYLVDHGR